MAIRFRIRSHSRFRVDCPVYFLGSNFLGKGSLVDLSRTGTRIEGEHTVPRGTLLAVRLFLPDREAPVRIDRASVRWCHGRDFGLQIHRISPGDSKRLGQFIRILAYKPFFWLS